MQGSQGVIWPAHINSRPDSDFKQRLLDALSKPFSRKEYIKLFDMASIRTPLVKLRQVRNDVKFYPTQEMGNSYFDHYPGMPVYRAHILFYMCCLFFGYSVVYCIFPQNYIYGHCNWVKLNPWIILIFCYRLLTICTL
jgi:hypothetical protein